MARHSKTFDVTKDIRYTPIEENASSEETAIGGEYRMLPADKICASPFNEGLDSERIEEYAESFRHTGLLEPIAVYDKGDGTYEIISGHQRYQAWCNILGNKTIKAVVRPWEEDPIKRFRAHTEANTLNRNLNVRFWISRIHHAKDVLRESGFTGTREEEIKRLSEMLNGISRIQLYRYENFEKLIPELQEFESRGWLSVMTLYMAAGLDEQQQKEVANRVWMLYQQQKDRLAELHADFEITRDMFKKIVDDVKQGKASVHMGRRISTYEERYMKNRAALTRVLSTPKTIAERDESLSFIKELREELSQLEETIKKMQF